MVLLLLSSGIDPGIVPCNPHPPEHEDKDYSSSLSSDSPGNQGVAPRLPPTKDIQGCYGCGGLNYWVRECPWILSNCKKLRCNDVMKLFTFTKASLYGLKFLKCQNVQCGKFMWLNDAIDTDEKVKEEERKKVVQNVKITVEMNIDDFIRDFKGKTTL
ncbi:hypothetical protein GIB67_004103 [Kingdonia uniflora]|uniref:Uncharacterized protein n=1 Tax=Kingdonia uniflora TaxID=39325 RepID=A0A7J7NR77_9MAGN|nr:hypothetical protein GIB67_004103 [Kingdonia uniflora]